MRELSASFAGTAYECTIMYTAASEATRPTDDRRREPCLKFTVTQRRLEEHTRWVDLKDLSFSFLRGVIEEIAPENAAHTAGE